MSRFTDYTDNAATADYASKFELISPTGALLATSYEAEAVGGAIFWKVADPPSLTFDQSGLSVRTINVKIPISTAELVPQTSVSLLHPGSGNRVRIQAGIMVAGSMIWWPQATMAIDEPEIEYERGIGVATVPLLDATAPTRVELTGSFSFAVGEAVEDVVARLLDLVVTSPADYNLAATGCVTPAGSLAVGDSISEAITDLLEGCGHELTADALGRIVSREVPPSRDIRVPERWRYGQVDGLPVQSMTRTWRSREPEGFHVEGGGIDGSEPAITTTVFDFDPASEGYYNGATTASLPTIEFPYTLTLPQAQAAGYARLRRTGSGPGLVQFSAGPNPALQPGDHIELEHTDLRVEGTYQVLGFTLPLALTETSFMQVTARKLWDPEKDVVPPFDSNPGCYLSFTDLFDRPNENLEDTPAEAGSLEWVEHGWSWAVVGERAIQRFDNGWSMAVVNTPLCYSNQYAEVVLDKLPSERPIGPCVRGSGGFEGYAALATRHGVIRIESWAAGQRQEVLERFDTDLMLEGRTLRIEAVGTEVRIVLDGTQLISVVDDRHRGSHVGMLALGGHTSRAPAVASFTAARAS